MMNINKKHLGILLFTIIVMSFIWLGYNKECNNIGYFIGASVFVLILQYTSYQGGK